MIASPARSRAVRLSAPREPAEAMTDGTSPAAEPHDAAPPRASGARPGPRQLLLAAAPALAVLAASFLHTEVLHGSWDRLNAICCVWDPSRSDVNDALPAMDAARALLEGAGAPIYDMSQTDRAAFLYPPIAAALYVPHVREGDAMAWSLVSWNRLVFVLVALLLAAALVGPRRRWPTALEALGVAAAMVAFLPMVRSLELNQASLHVALFVGAAWVALDRGADRAAGLFLALAAALKPHLFAMVPLLALHARRAAAAALVAGAGLAGASLALAGAANHVTYLTHVLPEAARGYAFFPNQSIGGLLHRLASDVPIDVFELMPPSPAVMRANVAIGLGLYAAAFAVIARARRREDLRREVFALAWLVATMIAPIAWGHHYAAALFPLAWLVGRARDGAEPDARRLGAFALGCALLGSYFVVGGLRGPGPRLLASYGLLGAFLCAATFARTLWTAASKRPATPGAAAVPATEPAPAPEPAPPTFAPTAAAASPCDPGATSCR